MFIDVLIFINIFVSFFAIKAASKLLHLRPSGKRVGLGCAVGGASSLLILLPPLNFIITSVIKIVLCAVIITVVFGLEEGFIKHSAVFFAVNSVFAGCLMLLNAFSAPLGMEYNNGYAYFDISAGILIVSTLASYFAIRILRYILDAKFNADRRYSLTVIIAGTEYKIGGFADSANNAFDVFRRPIIVADEKLFPPQESYIPMPVGSVGGQGIIKVIRPEKILIEGKSVDAVIGLSDNAPLRSALFNPKILV